MRSFIKIAALLAMAAAVLMFVTSHMPAGAMRVTMPASTTYDSLGCPDGDGGLIWIGAPMPQGGRCGVLTIGE